MYHNHDENAGRGNSDCAFTMGAIQKNFPNIVSGQISFDEKHVKGEDFRNMLTEIKSQSRSEFSYVYSVYQCSQARCKNAARCEHWCILPYMSCQ